jgi:hypothetical protein
MQIKHASVGAVSSPTPDTVKNYVVENVEPGMKKVSAQDIGSFFTSTAPAVTQQVEQALPLKRQGQLEKLIFLGRAEREVNIMGVLFKLTTLTSKETSDMVKELTSTNETDNTTIQILVLAQAIKSIDGVSINDIQVDGEFENAFKKRRFVVEQFQQVIVNKLVDEYQLLQDESRNVTGDEIKK